MKKKDLDRIILDDFYRYYGTRNKFEYFKRLYFNPNINFLRILRKANYYMRNRNILYYLYKVIHRRMFFKYGFQIPIDLKMGSGIYLGHFGNIVINKNVVLGSNINISQGVTLGQTNRGLKKGTPIIGNNVWIGANSVIVGNVKIGNNVLIAPLTFINFDVPSNSIVIGNPAKVIFNRQATDEYIQNRINILEGE